MSGNLPSVVGLALDRARQLLAEAGGQIEQVEITKPPFGTDRRTPEDRLRVVQQRPGTGNKVYLVVALQIRLEADGDSPVNPGNGNVSRH